MMTKEELRAKLDEKCFDTHEIIEWLAERGFVDAKPYTAYVYYMPDGGDSLGTSDDDWDALDNIFDYIDLNDLEQELKEDNEN